MGDAKDILGLPKVAPLGGSVEKRKTPKDAFKKPDGVSREVYALTGGLPPIMPALDPVNLKKRPAPTKKISWQWLPFTTTARTDYLQLYHWVRIVDGLPPSGDYAFAKYNKAVECVRYTDDEYNQHLSNDPGMKLWSRDDTDRLFDLCEQFDLRFIVIADRFTPPRTVEQLKSRYYSAAKLIVEARAGSKDELIDHPLFKDSYNVNHEIERKRALNIILSQSRQQDREDVQVLAEAKRITEARLNAKVAEEAELPLPVSRPVSTLDTASARPVSPSTTAVVDVPVSVSIPVGVASIPSAAAPSPAPVAPPPAGPRPPRVYSRAGMLAQQVQATVSTAGARTTKRVEQMLEEYGVRLKPKVPTQVVCTEHLELRKELLILLQLQKQVQYKESELAMLRENPFAEIPATPNTPKRSHRSGEHERVATRATAGGVDSEGFGSGEQRIGKREHKRKAPARFQEAPLSPPYHKRARKMKGSEG